MTLIEKFKEDKDTLPKNEYGNIKTVSLKAWLKRNDNKLLIDRDWSYGKFNLLGSERNIEYNYKGTYDTYDDLVDEAFHRQLKQCEREEDRYFLANDEYSILKQKLRNVHYPTTFGVEISMCSNGKISIVDGRKERDITIDELKELLEKYEQLDRLVDKITKETNIVY